MARLLNGDRAALSEAQVQELRAVYLGLASEVDHHIGRIVTFLKESGQWEETLLIVTSDHGEALGDFHTWAKEAPLDSCFDVPLILRDPRQPEATGRVEAMTESIDILPTRSCRSRLLRTTPRGTALM